MGALPSEHQSKAGISSQNGPTIYMYKPLSEGRAHINPQQVRRASTQCIVKQQPVTKEPQPQTLSCGLVLPEHSQLWFFGASRTFQCRTMDAFEFLQKLKCGAKFVAVVLFCPLLRLNVSNILNNRAVPNDRFSNDASSAARPYSWPLLGLSCTNTCKTTETVLALQWSVL